MEAQERQRIKTLLRKGRIATGKKYMKKAERKVIIDGYQALKTLGFLIK